MTPLLEGVRDGLLGQFERMGHDVQKIPNDRTDVILTSARFGEPIGWRQAPLFYSRRRFGLSHVPMFIAIVHAPPAAFQEAVDDLQTALDKEPPDPADFAFSALAPQAPTAFSSSRDVAEGPSWPWSAWCRPRPRVLASSW